MPIYTAHSRLLVPNGHAAIHSQDLPRHPTAFRSTQECCDGGNLWWLTEAVMWRPRSNHLDSFLGLAGQEHICSRGSWSNAVPTIPQLA